MTVTLEEASATLENLIEEAQKGEEVVIVKDDQPIAKLVATPKRARARAGSAKGQIWMSPDFDEPLEDFKDYM